MRFDWLAMHSFVFLVRNSCCKLCLACPAPHCTLQYTITGYCYIGGTPATTGNTMTIKTPQTG